MAEQRWKRSSVNLEAEQAILTSLITNDEFIKETIQILRPDLFQSSYAKIISKWCLEYFDKYKKAPNSDIQEIYKSAAKDIRISETQLDLIGDFLERLSEDYERSGNVAMKIDRAENYFRLRKIEELRDVLSGLLLKEKVDEAEKEIGEFKRIARPSTIGIDILRDNINHLFYEQDDVLFRLPGDLGNLVGDFCREDYVLIAAPEKRGKSFWLQEIGLKALLRGLNVIYYSLEMSEKKMLSRIFQYFTGESKKEDTIIIPYFHGREIEYKEIVKKGMTVQSSLKKRKQIEKMVNGKSFRLCVHPTGSINVDDIKVHLDNLEHYEGFIPDVILIDYADIMAPERVATKEERHKLNATQKALRGLAQERHALVASATQTNKSTFKKDIEQEDMAEDSRKLAHATHVIALNQTKEDKKRGIMRVGMVVARDDEFHIDDEVVVLECRKIGRCFLDSRWKNKLDIQ